jgi:hypothetical protein
MLYMLKDGSRSSEIIFHYFGSLFSGVYYRAGMLLANMLYGYGKIYSCNFFGFSFADRSVFSGWLFLFTF